MGEGMDGRTDGKTEGRMSENSPLRSTTSTGHWPFGIAVQKGRIQIRGTITPIEKYNGCQKTNKLYPL